MLKEQAVECPVCGFQLKGSRFAGYKCVRCHSYFSARFISQLRRTALRQLINQHFAPKHAIPEETRVQLVQIPEAVSEEASETIQETRQVIHFATQHLEDILGVAENVTLPQALAIPKKTAAPRKRTAKKHRR